MRTHTLLNSFRVPVIASILAASLVPMAAGAADKANVLLICCDDLNQSLGCYGNQQVQTPNIDALAKRGMRFTRAYAQWPSCLPSRFSFLSGWSPVTTKVTDFSFTSRQGPLEKAVYLPQHFRGHGYFAARLDKIFHIGKDDPASWTVSEEPYKDETGNFKAIWTGIELQTLGLTDRILEEGRYEHIKAESGPYQILDDKLKDEELFDGHNAKRAVELLERSAQDKAPFFLAVGFRRPHLPWLAPKRYFDLYPPESIELPPRQPEWTPKLTAREHREMISHYFAATTFADTQVGKVLDALERLELRENTIVVLFGDHGYCLGERDSFFAKGNLWERSLRTSLIIAMPDGAGAGTACEEPVELMDLYPTLVELCGLRMPGVVLEGHSLKPLLAGNTHRWRGHAISYNYNKKLKGLDRTIRTKRYRYTEKADGSPSECIDYESDPYEWKNRVGDPEFEEVEAALRKALRERIESKGTERQVSEVQRERVQP
jgi:arylsulfatase A-like enzyme